MLYNTLEECEIEAGKEYGYAEQVGSHWIIKPILLNADHVAKLLGCSKRTVGNMLHDGLLPEAVHPTPSQTRWTLKSLMPLVT